MPAAPADVSGDHDRQKTAAALRHLSSCSSLASLPSLCSGTPLRDELWQAHPAANIGKTVVYEMSPAEWLKTVSEIELSVGGGGPEKSVMAIVLSGSVGGGGCGVGRARAVAVAGSRVYTAHDDLKIRAWEIIRSSSVTVAGTGGGGGGVGFRLKLLASLPTTCDAILRSLVPSGYVEVRRHHHKLWIQHADAISALAVHANIGSGGGGRGGDGGFLYSASWDRSLKVWRLRDFTCLQSVAAAHDDAINALAASFAANSALLFSASADAAVKVWACSSRRPYISLLHVFPSAHRSAINALSVAPAAADGLPVLYSAACDKAIVVWRAQRSFSQSSQFTMSAAGALRGHRQAVLCLAAVTPAVPAGAGSGGILCSGSTDKTVRVWLRLPGAELRHVCIAVLTGQVGPVKCLLASPAASAAGAGARSLYVYSASWEHVVKAWRVDLR